MELCSGITYIQPARDGMFVRRNVGKQNLHTEGLIGAERDARRSAQVVGQLCDVSL